MEKRGKPGQLMDETPVLGTDGDGDEKSGKDQSSGSSSSSSSSLSSSFSDKSDGKGADNLRRSTIMAHGGVGDGLETG